MRDKLKSQNKLVNPPKRKRGRPKKERLKQSEALIHETGSLNKTRWQREAKEIREELQKLEGSHLDQDGKTTFKLRDLYYLNKDLAKRVARIDFLIGVERKSIREAYGIPEHSLNYWIHNDVELPLSWAEARDARHSAIVEAVYAAKEDILSDTLELSLKVLHKGLKELLVHRERMSVTELQKVSAIASDMHRVLKLENGQPTDIQAIVDVTPAGLRSAIEELEEIDPYVDYSKDEVLN